MDHLARIEALEAENARLRDRIDVLEGMTGTTGPEILPAFLGLTPKEAVLVGGLRRRKSCTKEQLLTIIYGALPPDDQPEIKIIDVFVCKIRKKLAPHGIMIRTLWGLGYELPPDSRSRLDAMIEVAA